MDKSKKHRVNITLSEGILNSIDTHARSQGLSRSAYISKLELDEMRREEKYIKENGTWYYDLYISPDNPLFEE